MCRRRLPEADAPGNLEVGELTGEELRVGKLAHVLRLVLDHREPLDAEAEVHHRHLDPVLGKRRGGVHAEGGDLHPAVGGVACIDLGLGIGDIVFGALLVGPKLEVRKPEGRKKRRGDRLAVLDRDVLACHDTGGGVVGHQPCGALLLLAAETPVDGELHDGVGQLVPHRPQRDEPPGGHVGPERRPGGLGGKGTKLGEDLLHDPHDEPVVAGEDLCKLIGQLVPVDLGLLVGMQGLSEALLAVVAEGPCKELFYLRRPLPADADVRPREAPKVEDPVEDRRCLGTELPVDVLLLDEERHPRLIEADGKVDLAQALDGLCDGMHLCPPEHVSGVPVRRADRVDDRGAAVPCVFKIPA